MLESFTVEEALKNAKENGINKLIIPTANPKDFPSVMELISKYDNVYGMLGVHPSDAKDWNDNIIEEIKTLAKNKKMGCCGRSLFVCN